MKSLWDRINERFAGWIWGLAFAAMLACPWVDRGLDDLAWLLLWSVLGCGFLAAILTCPQSFLLLSPNPFVDQMRRDGILPKLLGYFKTAIRAACLLPLAALLLIAATPLLGDGGVRWLHVAWGLLLGATMGLMWRAAHLFHRVAKLCHAFNPAPPGSPPAGPRAQNIP